MKCPVTVIAFAKGETVVRSGLMDCLKEECAWWLADINMCSVRDLALELRYAQMRLQDMVKKPGPAQ